VPRTGNSLQPGPTSVSLNVHSDTVREILRVAARAQSLEKPVAEPREKPAPRLEVQFRDDRVDHVECDVLQCYSYAKDGHIVRTTPRADFFGLMPEDPRSSDAWLACQDTNDLLSTFERYDRCRGIGASLTLPWNGGPNGISAPPRH